MMMSWSAEYVDSDYGYGGPNKRAIVAFPEYLPGGNTVLVIRNIFDSNFYLEVDEGFRPIFGGIDNLMFLNSDELYVEHYIDAPTSEVIDKRAIIVFDLLQASVAVSGASHAAARRLNRRL